MEFLFLARSFSCSLCFSLLMLSLSGRCWCCCCPRYSVSISYLFRGCLWFMFVLPEQVPQLSTSREIDVNDPFSLRNTAVSFGPTLRARLHLLPVLDAEKSLVTAVALTFAFFHGFSLVGVALTTARLLLCGWHCAALRISAAAAAAATLFDVPPIVGLFFSPILLRFPCRLCVCAIRREKGGGSTKCLLIGINYIGQQGELAGCHNDVDMMKKYITTHVRRHGSRRYVIAELFMPVLSCVVFPPLPSINHALLPDGRCKRRWFCSGTAASRKRFAHCT